MMRLSRRLLCVPMVGLLLAACGSDPEPEAAAPAPAPKPTAASASDETATYAKAVGDGKPGAAVNIRYEFAGKPSAGTPTEVDVALIPSVGVDSMEATLAGMDGITLAGNLKAGFSAVEAGKPYRHKISVLPDRTGVFYITVSVTTQIAGSSVGRTFSIPFVVGQPVAQQKAAPVKDEKGEAIEPMPAQQTLRKQ
ncbi:MAG: hypothetical protein ABW171_06525 [Steroidobacter sp.]